VTAHADQQAEGDKRARPADHVWVRIDIRMARSSLGRRVAPMISPAGQPRISRESLLQIGFGVSLPSSRNRPTKISHHDDPWTRYIGLLGFGTARQVRRIEEWALGPVGAVIIREDV